MIALVHPINHLAERLLYCAMIFRKLRLGTDSAYGSRQKWNICSPSLQRSAYKKATCTGASWTVCRCNWLDCLHLRSCRPVVKGVSAYLCASGRVIVVLLAPLLTGGAWRWLNAVERTDHCLE